MEVFPLERAPEAYDLMMSGKAWFRASLQQEINPNLMQKNICRSSCFFYCHVLVMSVTL